VYGSMHFLCDVTTLDALALSIYILGRVSLNVNDNLFLRLTSPKHPSHPLPLEVLPFKLFRRQAVAVAVAPDWFVKHLDVIQHISFAVLDSFSGLQH